MAWKERKRALICQSDYYYFYYYFYHYYYDLMIARASFVERKLSTKMRDMHIPSHCNDNHVLLFSLPPSNLPIIFILITLTIQSSPYMYLVKLQYTHHMTTLGTLCNPTWKESKKRERKIRNAQPWSCTLFHLFAFRPA